MIPALNVLEHGDVAHLIALWRHEYQFRKKYRTWRVFQRPRPTSSAFPCQSDHSPVEVTLQACENNVRHHRLEAGDVNSCVLTRTEQSRDALARSSRMKLSSLKGQNLHSRLVVGRAVGWLVCGRRAVKMEIPSFYPRFWLEMCSSEQTIDCGVLGCRLDRLSV